MAATAIDKVTCASGLLLLVGSLGWAFWQRPRLEAFRQQPAHVQLTGEPYAAGAGTTSGSRTEVWPDPASQTRGPEWIYDVFTPPEIYYNASTRQFSVAVPAPEKAPEAPVVEAPAPFGVELVRIQIDPFRLQIIGYVGNEANFRGTFQNTVSGEAFIGRSGRKVADLGITIVSVRLKRQRVEQADGTPLSETFAEAVVRDDASGEETTLTTREWRMNGAPSAILRAAGSDQEAAYKTGASFVVGEASYVVGAIQVEPPGVEVTKTLANSAAPETQLLTLPVPPSPTVSPDAAAVPSEAPATVPSPF